MKKTGMPKAKGQYNKHRRKLQREREQKFWDQRRSIRDTNCARLADGRGYRGGGRYAGAEE